MAESPKVPRSKEYDQGKTDPNQQLKGEMRWEERESKVTKKRRIEREEAGSQERTKTKRAVLETDTGGQVRDALRHRENGPNGTRPNDSVT